jgi:hypothetical protein
MRRFVNDGADSDEIVVESMRLMGDLTYIENFEGTHSLTYSLTHSLILSFIYSLAHSPRYCVITELLAYIVSTL